MSVFAAPRRLFYRVFYSLPTRWRRRLVRLVMPKWCVGAVGIVRDAEAAGPGRVLLVLQPPGLGWSLPAGLLDKGERPIDACVRELAEETGVVVTAEALRPAVPNAIVYPKGRWVDVVFEASVPASTVTLRPDGFEVLEVAWHPLDALPPLTPGAATVLGHYGIGPYAEYPEVRA